uniref:Uncharacterized protein n=1 Tax=Siphoviridae sp. ctYaH2 TaxID=2825549 RepID=A0A8S5V593_9CAUD|nr:MAG TPA: hypothetical protein [Siphoviridae sp. ctYaH2]
MRIFFVLHFTKVILRLVPQPHICLVIRPSSFVPRHFFPFPSLHSPSPRKSAKAEYVRRGRFLLIFHHTPPYCLCPKTPHHPIFSFPNLLIL